MFDVKAIKQRNDLADVVTASLGAPVKVTGGRLYWLCPWHDDHDPSLEVNVKQQRWYCPPCDLSGDVIGWVMRWEGVEFSEACERLGAEKDGQTAYKPQHKPTPSPPPPERTAPPGTTWQERARAFVCYAQEQLWTDAGQVGLTYLREERGLSDDTIRAWGLGWNPKDWWDTPGRWGLEGKKVWLPVGVVIPCEVDGAIWYAKIRRFGADGRPLTKSGDKYGGPRESKGALFGLDKLQGRDMAIICESELDAMLLWQEIGKVGRPVDVLAVGGAGRRLEGRWLGYLTTFKRLVVAFDLDSAGQDANTRWLSESDRVRRAHIPKLSDKGKGYDLTDFWRDGGRLHDWAEYHLVKFYELEQGTDERPFVGQDDTTDPTADPTADLLRQLRAEQDDGRWCDLLTRLNLALCEEGELEPTYTVDGRRFVTFGCETLTQREVTR